MIARTQLTVPVTGLPIEAARDAIEAEVAGTGAVVVRAEPGAGKSSLVPLFVAGRRGGGGRVVVTEPRRLAARATATRLAELLGEPLGRTVGLSMRGEHTVSDATRIEVVTEAVLTNRIQRDPELAGVAALVFDEFHERNLHSDLGLAMALEARAALRDDLAIVVMSATLDTERVAALIGAASVVDVPGRTFPVTTHHLARPERSRFAPAVADAVVTALAAVTGDVLAFVPGRREIDDVLAALAARGVGGRGVGGGAGSPVECVGLHGSTPVDVQRSILRGRPAGGAGPGARQRVIVATAVAETSVTVPGVEAVVDGGLLRRARFDPATGLGRLETGFATAFAAEQRRGRAGRVGPGVCWRLWSAEEHRHLEASTAPEIVDGDPLPVAFELARWGDPWARSLPLLDHPGEARLEAAQRLLGGLGLTGDDGRLTEVGRRAARLGLHPRLAVLVLTGEELGLGELARRAAALLDDDTWPDRPDLAAELERRWGSMAAPADRLAQRIGTRPSRAPSTARPAGAGAGSIDELGALLARAWPDRVGMARPDRPGRFLLSIGREVMVGGGGRGGDDRLAGAPFVVVAEADGDPRAARVRRAVAVDRATVLAAAADRIRWVEHVAWDQRDDTLRAERQQRLGGLVLHRQPLAEPGGAAVAEALAVGLRTAGLALLRWGERGGSVRARLAWLHEQDPAAWPDLGDEVLLARLDEWLDLSRCRSVADLRRIDATGAVLGLLGWEQRRQLDVLAPAELTLPGGRSRPVRYGGGRPVWSVRIQHLFGLDEHPVVGPNRVPVAIELLSPADRPAQVTTDLPGFWRGSYRAVRADLRGRYPKHAWPEDPLAGAGR
ncbi:MAG: ATP-dependent helicase HrpB [Acidimicrobiales bacterium]